MYLTDDLGSFLCCTFKLQAEDHELETLQRSLRESMAVNLSTQCTFFQKDPKVWAANLEHVLDIIFEKKSSGELQRATLRLWKRKVVRHKKCIMMRVALRIMSRLVSQCFSKWLDTLKESHVNQHKVGKIMGWLTQRLTTNCYVLWMQNVAESKYMRRKARKALACCLHTSQGASLGAWQQHSMQQARMRVILARVVTRIIRTCMIKVWVRWTASTLESKRQHAILGKVCLRLLKRGMTIGFETWHLQVVSLCKVRGTLKRVCHRLSQKVVYTAFASWMHILEQTKRNEVEEQRRKSIITRVVPRMTNMATNMVFNKWAEQAQQGRRSHLIISKVTRCVNTRLVYQAMHLWLCNVRELAVSRAKGCRAIHGAKVRSLRSWHVYTQNATRKRAVTSRVLKRMSQHCVLAGWQTWAEQVQQGTRSRLIISKVTGRMKSGLVYQAMCTWLCNVQELAVSRTEYCRAIEQRKKRVRVRCLDSWHMHTMKETHTRDMLMRVLMRIENKVLVLSLDAWYLYTQKGFLRRHICTKISNRIRNNALFVGWNTWMGGMQENVHERDVLAQAFGRANDVDKDLVGQALSEWRRFVEAKLQSCRHTQVLARRYTCRRIHMMFLAWNSMCWRNRSKRTVCSYLMMQEASETLALAIRGWHWETQANRRASRKVLQKWMCAWMSLTAMRIVAHEIQNQTITQRESTSERGVFSHWHRVQIWQKNKTQVIVRKINWCSTAAIAAVDRHMQRAVHVWRVLSVDSVVRHLRLIKLQRRGRTNLERSALFRWMHCLVMRRRSRRAHGLICRRWMSNVSRQNVAVWRMTITWILTLKLALKTIVNNQIVRMFRRIWTSWRLGQGECKRMRRQWTGMLMTSSAILGHDQKTRGKNQAMQNAVCKRYRKGCCKRHFRNVFDSWKDLVASYIGDYHLNTPTTLGRGDVFVHVATLYVVTRAKHFIAEWRRTVHTGQRHRHRTYAAGKLGQLRHASVLQQQLLFWHEMVRHKSHHGRILSIVAQRLEIRCKHWVLRRWVPHHMEHIRLKRIQMKMQIRTSGLIVDKVLRHWRGYINQTGSLLQIQSIIHHRCGMELESQSFHLWHTRKEAILRTIHSAWASLAIGISLMAKPGRRPLTLASFIRKRKKVSYRRLNKRVLHLIMSWHALRVNQEAQAHIVAILSCQPTQVRLVRMCSFLNTWKVARNYGIAARAPLEMTRPGHKFRLCVSCFHQWLLLTSYLQALRASYRNLVIKIEGRWTYRILAAWQHLARTNCTMRLKIKRSAEMCVKYLWVSLRIVCLHWIKVIQSQRRLVHTSAIARRASVRTFARRHFTGWRGILWARLMLRSGAAPKEMEASSRMLQGDAERGYQVWNQDSSETDIDADSHEENDHDDDNDDYNNDGRNAKTERGESRKDSSGGDDNDNHHFDEVSSIVSSVKSNSHNHAPTTPVYISEKAQMPTFEKFHVGYQPSFLNDELREVAAVATPNEATPFPGANVARMVSASPGSIHFREGLSSTCVPLSHITYVPLSHITYVPLSHITYVPLSQRTIGWQTWVPENERLAHIAATFARRQALRAMCSVFALWAAVTQVGIASTHQLSCILSISQQRILGGHASPGEICAAAPMLRSKIVARSLVLLFDLWAGVLAFRKMLRNRMRPFSGKQCCLNVSRYFFAWLTLTNKDQHKAAKRKVALLLGYSHEHMLLLVFSGWKLRTRHRVLLLHRESTVKERLHRDHLGHHFLRWVEASGSKESVQNKHSVQHKDSVQHKHLAIAWSSSRNALVLHFIAWMDKVQHTVTVNSKVQRKQRRSQSQRKQQVLVTWYEVTTNHKASRRKAMSIFTRKYLYVLVIFWGAWLDQSSRAVELDSMGLHVLKRSVHRLRSDAFSSWMTVTQDAAAKRKRLATTVDRKFQRCFFLVWRHYMGVTEVLGYSMAVATMRLQRFIRCFCMRRALFKWHRHVNNGHQVLHALRLACFRRVRKLFQDFRYFMASRALRTRLGNYITSCRFIRCKRNCFVLWKGGTDDRLRGAYLVQDRLSEVYLSLSPFPKTFAPSRPSRF